MYPRLFEGYPQLNASSSACLNLVVHLPFILKDCFENESPEILICFAKLIQIIHFILSPIIRIEMLDNLETLIATHQELFIRCYGSDNIIPKMHMMVHLPEQIRQHGPTRHHWTMRMEAKNRKYFNFKNLSLSVSKYFLMHFATMFWNKGAEVKKEIFMPHSQVFDMGKENIIVEKSFLNNDITENDLGKSCMSFQKVMINSVPFSVGDIIFSGNMVAVQNTFSKIVKILFFNDKLYFYCNVLFIHKFLVNINVFDMKISKIYDTFSATDLLHPWPLLNYLINGNIYVILPCIYHCNTLFDF